MPPSDVTEQPLNTEVIWSEHVRNINKTGLDAYYWMKLNLS